MTNTSDKEWIENCRLQMALSLERQEIKNRRAMDYLTWELVGLAIIVGIVAAGVVIWGMDWSVIR
jgi:hypothetical protein